MTHLPLLPERCEELFARYPQASRAQDPSRSIRSMILMLHDDQDDGFYELIQERRETTVYSLRTWPNGDSCPVAGKGYAPARPRAQKVVTRGVPIPRDGSLLGWKYGNTITALIVIYATTAYPEPGWAVMPRVGTSESQWPPFTGKPLFGHWLWEYYESGTTLILDGLLAGITDTVFWIDTSATIGSDCCVVECDITSPKGCVLRRGRYVYYQVLEARKTIPPLQPLLDDNGKIDLAPRFWQAGQINGWSAVEA